MVEDASFELNEGRDFPCSPKGGGRRERREGRKGKGGRLGLRQLVPRGMTHPVGEAGEGKEGPGKARDQTLGQGGPTN
jgi:hypothetical protein